MRLLHIMLHVGNLDKSIHFYTNVLGMRVLRCKARESSTRAETSEAGVVAPLIYSTYSTGSRPIAI